MRSSWQVFGKNLWCNRHLNIKIFIKFHVMYRMVQDFVVTGILGILGDEGGSHAQTHGGYILLVCERYLLMPPLNNSYMYGVSTWVKYLYISQSNESSYRLYIRVYMIYFFRLNEERTTPYNMILYLIWCHIIVHVHKPLDALSSL